MDEIKDKTLDDLIKKHEWKEYDGEDKGFHYCSKCGQAAFNYEDGNEVAELLSDFCPWCGEPLTKNGWNKLRKRLEGM